MSSETFPLTSTIALSNIKCRVQLVADKTLKETTVETVNLEDDRINIVANGDILKVTGTFPTSQSFQNGFSIMQGTSRGRSSITVGRTGGISIQSGGDISINGDTITLDGEIFHIDESSQGGSRWNPFRKKTKVVSSGTTAKQDLASALVIIRTPAASIHSKGCKDVSGTIDGNLTADLSGIDRMHLKGAQLVDMTVSGTATVELLHVTGYVKLHASGASSVDVSGQPTGVQADTSGTSRVSINGAPAEYPVSVMTTGASSLAIDGDTEHLYVIASGTSSFKLRGTCQSGEVRASGSSNVHVGKALAPIVESQSGVARIYVGR